MSTHFDHRFVIDLSTLIHILCVDFQDLHPSLLIGKRDFNLPVESTRTKKCRIKSIRSIGSHDELGTAERVESIHLIKELSEEEGDMYKAKSSVAAANKGCSPPSMFVELPYQH
jgi:hypothetical protein